ncbi:RNA polymerase sigma factor [Pseudopedobacter beijingensis]|uniref:RNA polymerase sigma factor n=1 Tax=Pseudopedobacter beijingensis TaxID=1207056 RepID=A0ABW4I6W0_9SPHI
MILNSDINLLAQLKQGESAAFDAMFKKYYKVLCVNALFYLKSEEDAEDLVQTFFIEFAEKRLYLKLEGEIKGYLFRSIQNRCLNHIRASNNLKRKQESIELKEEIADDNDAMELRENMYVLMEQALCDMPAQRRQALTMVYLENKKYQDAADKMGISINSLKTHLKIGLKSLREKIKNKKEFTCITIFIVYIIKYIYNI